MENKNNSIASICWYKIYPPQTGGQNGIVYFNEALAIQNKVHCICSSNNEIDPNSKVEIQPILKTSKWQFLQWSSYKKILNEVKKHSSKIVIIEHPYYFLLHYFKKKYAFKLVVHTHNIEFNRAKKNGKWYWQFIKIAEKIAYQKADSILCKTMEDKNFIVNYFKINDEKINILPYCTTITTLPENRIIKQDWLKKQYKLSENTKIFLFAASFDYKPNQQAFLHLVQDIYPLMEKNFSYPFVIILCGTHLQDYIKKTNVQLPSAIIATGFVVNINDYFIGADVFINTVQISEGVQTKNIDALANNCNVVCYQSSINGMPNDVIDSKLFCAENSNTQQFVALILKALDKVNENTPTSFYTKFNWEKRVESIQAKF